MLVLEFPELDRDPRMLLWETTELDRVPQMLLLQIAYGDKLDYSKNALTPRSHIFFLSFPNLIARLKCYFGTLPNYCRPGSSIATLGDY